MIQGIINIPMLDADEGNVLHHCVMSSALKNALRDAAYAKGCSQAHLMRAALLEKLFAIENEQPEEDVNTSTLEPSICTRDAPCCASPQVVPQPHPELTCPCPCHHY